MPLGISRSTVPDTKKKNFPVAAKTNIIILKQMQTNYSNLEGTPNQLPRHLNLKSFNFSQNQEQLILLCIKIKMGIRENAF